MVDGQSLPQVAKEGVLAKRGDALQLLGDSSVTETYAFLMDHLTHNERWLRGVLGAEAVEEFLAQSRFHKLWYLRRYAAKLLYELELHQAPAWEALPDRYARGLSEALGVRVSPVNYLADVDDGYYAARYLRAWMLQAHVAAWLEADCGVEWFLRPAAGARLRALWRQGDSLSGEELAAHVGATGIDPEPLLRELVGA